MSEEQNQSFIKSLHEVEKMFFFLSDKGWLNDKTKLIRHHCEDNFIIHKVSDVGFHLFNLFTTTYQKQLTVTTLEVTEKTSENKLFRYSVIIAYCDEDNTLYYKGNVKTELIEASTTSSDIHKIEQNRLGNNSRGK